MALFHNLFGSLTFNGDTWVNDKGIWFGSFTTEKDGIFCNLTLRSVHTG